MAYSFHCVQPPSYPKGFLSLSAGCSCSQRSSCLVNASSEIKRDVDLSLQAKICVIDVPFPLGAIIPTKEYIFHAVTLRGICVIDVPFPLGAIIPTKEYIFHAVTLRGIPSLLDSVKWDEKGLAVAIAQNVDTGAILMQGFANRDALSKTLSTGKATFFSRSRSSLWTKGETSMNFINICDIFLDCDRDSIIYLGKPDGPTCHTGAETCYYSSVADLLGNSEAQQNDLAMSTLYSLESTISKRRAELGELVEGKPSWTKRLLLDDKLLCSKIREEADELCRTLEDDEDKSRTASEMADVLYHSMVLLNLRGVAMEDVLEILRKRFSQSGIDEKRSRKLG